MNQRLQGVRIVVTRAAHQSDEFADALRQKGADVILAPAIELVPNNNTFAYENCLQHLLKRQVTRILFGSINAAVALQRILQADERFVGCEPFDVSCVGHKTALRIQEDPLLRVWFNVSEIAEDARSEGLADTIMGKFGIQSLANLCFFYPGAKERRPALEEMLVGQGALVLRADLYKIGPVSSYSKEMHEKLSKADIFTFFSGRTLQCFLKACGDVGATYLERSKVAVIGPVACEQAKAMGIRVDLLPSDVSTEGLIEVLISR